MRIVSVLSYRRGYHTGWDFIEVGPGRTVVYGWNGTGKSRLFRGMRTWSRPVDDVSALPGWTADATDVVGAWGDVARVVMDVDYEGDDMGARCVFLDDEGLERQMDGDVGPWTGGDVELGALDRRFALRLARMAGDDLERRGVAPALHVSNECLVLAGLENTPSGLRTIAALALALALRDVRSPGVPLVIDGGGLGMLDREQRDRAVQELADLDGQVVLFTGVEDVVWQLGMNHILPPRRRARGRRTRGRAPRRQ